eukprot:TRINITY_DN19852_c0_g1_i2.p1 TRINITY_DN19852_c0_g1~~TRINITY_DN19852_c0_g1_i2.p1  ORF type:complete len:546 (-),score=108.07 TRINITY_DN19852_c0_g1_i2:45-1682(-)
MDEQREAATRTSEQRTAELQQMVSQAEACLHVVQQAEAAAAQDRLRADEAEAAMQLRLPVGHAASRSLVQKLLGDVQSVLLRSSFAVWRQALFQAALPPLTSQLQEAMHSLERAKTSDWELRQRLARQRECAARRWSCALSRSSVKAMLLAWRFTLCGGPLAVAALSQERLLSSAAHVHAGQAWLRAALGAWRSYCAWQQQAESPHRPSEKPQVQEAAAEASPTSLRRLLFCAWRWLAGRRHRLHVKHVLRSQASWRDIAVLLVAVATWRQCAQRSGLLRWSSTAKSSALLRIVVGTWRLAAFELRTVPGSGASTPQHTSRRPSTTSQPQVSRSDLESAWVVEPPAAPLVVSEQRPELQRKLQVQHNALQQRHNRQDSQDTQGFETPLRGTQPGTPLRGTGAGKAPLHEQLRQLRLEQQRQAAAPSPERQRQSHPEQLRKAKAPATSKERSSSAGISSARRSNSTPRVAGAASTPGKRRQVPPSDVCFASTAGHHLGERCRNAARYSAREPQKQPVAHSHVNLQDLRACHTPVRTGQRSRTVWDH